jgi:phenylpropionate dioxygenase-like ring-hydroxylating dioxygenase large terminal subunit
MTKQDVLRPFDDCVRKEAYYDPAFVALEKARLWPRVWQMACRAEEVAKVGDYATYEIGDESIVVVRAAADRLNAFYNVCRHRGRRIAAGCGAAERLRCPFHGWQWDLDGENVGVTFREEFGQTLDESDLGLERVRCETWGGWVFVNFDPQAEPLEAWLGEAAKILAPFELEKMRYRWRKWLVMPCNWKIALEAFNEGYHVGVTHYKLHRFGAVSPFVGTTSGPHGAFASVASETGTLGVNASRAAKVDARRQLAEFYRYLKTALDSNMTDTVLHAAERLEAEVADDASAGEVIQRLMALAMEEDAAKGVTWPSITPEQYQAAGIDWHLFPNMVLLPMATNCLGYRARPNGDDPDSCIFEVYQLERFAEGAAPKVENLRNDDIRDEAFWGEILLQDFQQMEATHRGVKSRSYRGPKLNPRQEQPIANFHRVYHELLSRP